MEIWISAIASTVLVSILSLSGIVIVALKGIKTEFIVFSLISFAIGTLFGNSFFVLLPESFHVFHDGKMVGMLVMAGFLVMLGIEKVVHVNHNHKIKNDNKIMPLGYISLVTDGLHNFTDGILIAAGWMTSPEIGITTTLAVILHEIPQEISDFGVLIHAGFKRKKALWFNFLSAITAIAGAVVTLWAGSIISSLSVYVLPVAAGGFIYLAGSSLVPEINKEKSIRKNVIQFAFIFLGLMLMHSLSGSHSHTHTHETTHPVHTILNHTK